MLTINRQTIEQGLQSRPTSLAGLFKAMGGTGKPSQSARATILREWPGIMDELAGAKQAAAPVEAPAPQAQEPAPQAAPEQAPAPEAGKAKPARKGKAKARKAKAREVKAHVKSEKLKGFTAKAEGNPYTHKGSSYGATFDSVALHPGHTRDFHVKRLVALTGKAEANVLTAFKVVIESAVPEADQKAIKKPRLCSRHRSCQGGYVVRAELNKGGDAVYTIKVG